MNALKNLLTELDSLTNGRDTYLSALILLDTADAELSKAMSDSKSAIADHTKSIQEYRRLENNEELRRNAYQQIIQAEDSVRQCSASLTDARTNHSLAAFNLKTAQANYNRTLTGETDNE